VSPAALYASPPLLTPQHPKGSAPPLPAPGHPRDRAACQGRWGGGGIPRDPSLTPEVPTTTLTTHNPQGRIGAERSLQPWVAAYWPDLHPRGWGVSRSSPPPSFNGGSNAFAPTSSTFGLSTFLEILTVEYDITKARDSGIRPQTNSTDILEQMSKFLRRQIDSGRQRSAKQSRATQSTDLPALPRVGPQRVSAHRIV